VSREPARSGVSRVATAGVSHESRSGGTMPRHR